MKQLLEDWRDNSLPNNDDYKNMKQFLNKFKNLSDSEIIEITRQVALLEHPNEDRIEIRDAVHRLIPQRPSASSIARLRRLVRLGRIKFT